MAINVKNVATSEVIRISGIKVVNGVIVPKKNNLGQRFISAHAAELTCTEAEGVQVFTVNDGFELVTGRNTGESKKHERAARRERKPKDEEPQPTEKAEAEAEAVEVEKEPCAENAQEAENVPTDENENANEQALIAALKNLRGGAVNAAKVEEIVCNVLNRMAKEDPKKVSAVVKKARQNAKKGDEVYCEKFERIVAKVARGNNVYLYGRAGSGKSHTAEQVAERLGLDFYGQTTIQFAHDVRGYGDAGGNFQETPFFKAFAHGGLYFQDEYDRSNSEAAIVLNSALANGWYDFPIVGRVNAHPNFRFMAAGNTLMKGADEEYITGQVIDPSCRDRFGFFFEVDYNHTVEMKIAGGNEEIVAFVEDIREAIRATKILHVVSYRATAAMRDEVENENDKEACIVESVCKGLEKDEIREIYGALKNKDNVWAKAMKKAF